MRIMINILNVYTKPIGHVTNYSIRTSQKIILTVAQDKKGLSGIYIKVIVLDGRLTREPFMLD